MSNPMIRQAPAFLIKPQPLRFTTRWRSFRCVQRRPDYYQFSDAVALAGHSCPTVASAYLMTRAALKALYGNDIPVRGNIAVVWQDERDEGVWGDGRCGDAYYRGGG